MTGGRYLWWLMVSAAAFIVAAVLLEYVMWIALHIWGCRNMTAACARTPASIAGVIQTIAMYGAAVVVITATVVRLRWLRLNVLWAVAATFWIAMSIPFVSDIDILWKTRLHLADLLVMPPSAVMFLAGLLILLSAPLEDYAHKTSQLFAGSQYLVCAAVVYAIFFAVITQPSVIQAVVALSGIPLVGQVATPLLRASDVLQNSSMAGTISGTLALVIFLAGITISLALHTRIDARGTAKRCRRREVIERSTRKRADA